jgi:hypothetical protein
VTFSSVSGKQIRGTHICKSCRTIQTNCIDGLNLTQAGGIPQYPGCGIPRICWIPRRFGFSGSSARRHSRSRRPLRVQARRRNGTWRSHPAPFCTATTCHFEGLVWLWRWKESSRNGSRAYGSSSCGGTSGSTLRRDFERRIKVKR